MKKEELRLRHFYMCNYYGTRYPCELLSLHNDYAVVKVYVQEEPDDEDDIDIEDIPLTCVDIEVKYDDIEPYPFEKVFERIHRENQIHEAKMARKEARRKARKEAEKAVK